LDGTFIANIYDPEADGGSNEKINFDEKSGKKGPNKVFDQADIEAELSK